jgi:hypothetical protein
LGEGAGQDRVASSGKRAARPWRSLTDIDIAAVDVLRDNAAADGPALRTVGAPDRMPPRPAPVSTGRSGSPSWISGATTGIARWFA